MLSKLIQNKMLLSVQLVVCVGTITFKWNETEIYLVLTDCTTYLLNIFMRWIESCWVRECEVRTTEEVGREDNQNKFCNTTVALSSQLNASLPWTRDESDVYFTPCWRHSNFVNLNNQNLIWLTSNTKNVTHTFFSPHQKSRRDLNTSDQSMTMSWIMQQNKDILSALQ